MKPSLARRIKPRQWSGKDREPIFITYDNLLAASCGLEGTGDPTEVVYHLAALAKQKRTTRVIRMRPVGTTDTGEPSQ